MLPRPAHDPELTGNCQEIAKKDDLEGVQLALARRMKVLIMPKRSLLRPSSRRAQRGRGVHCRSPRGGGQAAAVDTFHHRAAIQHQNIVGVDRGAEEYIGVGAPIPRPGSGHGRCGRQRPRNGWSGRRSPPPRQDRHGRRYRPKPNRRKSSAGRRNWPRWKGTVAAARKAKTNSPLAVSRHRNGPQLVSCGRRDQKHGNRWGRSSGGAVMGSLPR